MGEFRSRANYVYLAPLRPTMPYTKRKGPSSSHHLPWCWCRPTDEKKINMYQKIYLMFIYFFILVLFLFILLWCLLIVLRQMHARIQEIISWGGGCGGYIVCGGGSGSGSGGQSPFSIFRELSDPFLDPRMKCKPLYIYFSLRFRALICNSNIYN